MRYRSITMLTVGTVTAAALLGGTAALAAGAVSPRATPPRPPNAAPHPGNDRDRDQDRAAFDELLRRQERGWADKNGAEFASTFTNDADLVTFNGDYLRTKKAVAQGMQFYFDHYIDDTTLRTLDEHVRFIDRRTAVVVRTTCQLRKGESECRAGSKSVNTNLMTKRNGTWLQQSFQNTRKAELPHS
ncbi:SgcJ/EcaC family oxidoreductase [Streptomyces sp. NPDC057654]|uniref:SgcJ/EcaC family oxidoreductase n=1 Tax=Streptomyces sp. NPDC057654 TaxID=3346196 RepID=UPI0036834C12